MSIKQLEDKDLRKMVTTLYHDECYYTGFTKEFIERCYYRTKEQGPYTLAQRNQIVILFNDHIVAGCNKRKDGKK